MVFFQKEKQKSLDQVMKITLIRQFVFYGFKMRNINKKIFLLINYKKHRRKSTNERKKIISKYYSKRKNKK